MSDVAGRIYIGTILLEPNRWAKPRRPSCRVGDWLGRFAAAGFDGIELWEYHYTDAESAERAAREDLAFLRRRLTGAGPEGLPRSVSPPM